MQSLKLLHPRLMVPLKDEMIKEVCCGYAHTLAVNQYGQLFTWGNNDVGQLGLGNDPNIPVKVMKPVLNTNLSNVSMLGAGNEHSMALTKNSQLYVWGAAAQTGLDLPPTVEKQSTPTILEYFGKHKIHQIACGGLHSIVLTKSGEIYTWGSTEGGQLGLEGLTEDIVSTP